MINTHVVATTTMAMTGLEPVLTTSSCLEVARFTLNQHCRSIDIAHAFAQYSQLTMPIQTCCNSNCPSGYRTFGGYAPIYLSGIEPD